MNAHPAVLETEVASAPVHASAILEASLQSRPSPFSCCPAAATCRWCVMMAMLLRVVCCPHLLQVTWQNLTAGAVIITVQGFNIPVGPQNYSLVVQGQFSGQLQSPYNPAWAPRAVPGNCSLPVAQITASPRLITNHTSPHFNFTTAADPAPNGFECKLSGFVTTGVTGVIHDWTNCTSPRRERNLTDGRYLFEVRAQGATCSCCASLCLV